ncbi:MAG: hypothetical protein FWB76_06130, partial [Oscillospiraceae bacterium]|nr:hypothetical protein [Oscillospiraceae bacterium]
MKKLPLALLALLMALVMVLAACGTAAYVNGNDETTTEAYTEAYTEPEEDNDNEVDNDNEPDEDVLPADATVNDDNDDDNDRPPLPVGNAAILAEYAAVMQQIKDRQPTYTSVNFQRITNRNQLPEDMVAMLDDSFFAGGTNNLFPGFLGDSRMLTHEAQARANPDRRVHGRPDGGGRFPGGGLGSTARWIG